jgi:hypothetical protein
MPHANAALPQPIQPTNSATNTSKWSGDMNTDLDETMVQGADFAERVHCNQQQLGARGALVRRLGAFERMYHRYEQKSTMHFCVVAELTDDLDPSALDAALLAVQQRQPNHRRARGVEGAGQLGGDAITPAAARRR